MQYSSLALGKEGVRPMHTAHRPKVLCPCHLHDELRPLSGLRIVTFDHLCPSQARQRKGPHLALEFSFLHPTPLLIKMLETARKIINVLETALKTIITMLVATIVTTITFSILIHIFDLYDTLGIPKYDENKSLGENVMIGLDSASRNYDSADFDLADRFESS